MSGNVELKRAVKLAVRMREAQRQYFKTRDRDDLVASKKLEKEFDTLAAVVLADDDLFNAGDCTDA